MNQQNYYKKYLKYKNKYINLKAKYRFNEKLGKWEDTTTGRSLDDIESEKSRVISAIKKKNTSTSKVI